MGCCESKQSSDVAMTAKSSPKRERGEVDRRCEGKNREFAEWANRVLWRVPAEGAGIVASKEDPGLQYWTPSEERRRECAGALSDALYGQEVQFYGFVAAGSFLPIINPHGERQQQEQQEGITSPLPSSKNPLATAGDIVSPYPVDDEEEEEPDNEEVANKRTDNKNRKGHKGHQWSLKRSQEHLYWAQDSLMTAALVTSTPAPDESPAKHDGGEDNDSSVGTAEHMKDVTDVVRGLVATALVSSRRSFSEYNDLPSPPSAAGDGTRLAFSAKTQEELEKHLPPCHVLSYRGMMVGDESAGAKPQPQHQFQLIAVRLPAPTPTEAPQMDNKTPSADTTSVVAEYFVVLSRSLGGTNSKSNKIISSGGKKPAVRNFRSSSVGFVSPSRWLERLLPVGVSIRKQLADDGHR